MSAARAVALCICLLVAHSCPSAYQRTYDQEMQRLERAQGAADAQAAAEHREASRYAAVVYFDLGSAAVGPDGRRELGWFVEKLQPYPEAVVLVQGFADTTGAVPENQSLSEDRARAVAAVLGAQGIAPSRLDVQGYGTGSPAASNTTAAGRSRNRRVEVTVR